MGAKDTLVIEGGDFVLSEASGPNNRVSTQTHTPL